jgi:prevent-host-death family protein
MCYMTTVGIRELRQNASAVLRRVVAGETVEVTDHGHPIARIVPLHPERTLDQLVAEGRATEAAVDLLTIKPVPAAKGERRLSDVLADMRADER